MTPDPLNPAGILVLTELAGRVALLIDGTVQSVDARAGEAVPSGYWSALVPAQIERPERTLVLGLGGGTVVQLLFKRFGEPLTIVGVDDDPRVIEIARSAFKLETRELTVVVSDALAYLRRSAGEHFDLIVVDLFRGGRIPELVCSRRFLRLVASALTVRGVLTINLNRGRQRAHQLRRLRLRFISIRLIGTGMNLVVHCRARRRTYKVTVPASSGSGRDG